MPSIWQEPSWVEIDTSLLFSQAKQTWFGELNLFWKHMQGRKFQEVQLGHEEELYCAGG